MLRRRADACITPTETFWQNEEWDADVRLDGVVCVVDAMWGVKVSEAEPGTLAPFLKLTDSLFFHLAISRTRSS